MADGALPPPHKFSGSEAIPKRDTGRGLARWVAPAFLLILFGIGLVGATKYNISVSLQPILPPASSGSAYQPSFTSPDGEELVLVFVGSSTCGFSNDPELPIYVETLKLDLSEYATERGLSFRAMGIAVDWSTQAGLDHLETFGAFDELSVGNNWANQALIRHTWDHGHPPRTPAVFILHRDVFGEEGPGGLLRWTITGQRVLLWRSGLEEIRSLTRLDPSRYLRDLNLESDDTERLRDAESALGSSTESNTSNFPGGGPQWGDSPNGSRPAPAFVRSAEPSGNHGG